MTCLLQLHYFTSLFKLQHFSLHPAMVSFGNAHADSIPPIKHTKIKLKTDRNRVQKVSHVRK